MKLLLISFFALFIIGLSPAQDLNPSIPRDRTNLDGDMLYETHNYSSSCCSKMDRAC